MRVEAAPIRTLFALLAALLLGGCYQQTFPQAPRPDDDDTGDDDAGDDDTGAGDDGTGDDDAGDDDAGDDDAGDDDAGDDDAGDDDAGDDDAGDDDAGDDDAGDDDTAVDSDGDGTHDDADCEPLDPTIYPGNGARVDGIDSDCDGRRDWLVTVYLSVDDDFEWCVDDEATLTPGNTTWGAGMSSQVWLRSGTHTLGIFGWDTGQVITAAIAHWTISDGTFWTSDASWTYDPQPAAAGSTRVGWCSTGFDDSAWQSVQVIGPIGTSPWGNAPSVFPAGSPAQWIWDHFPVNLNTQYLRKEFTLP